MAAAAPSFAFAFSAFPRPTRRGAVRDLPLVYVQLRNGEPGKGGRALAYPALIDTGADAKAVIGEGLVAVNGETEVRRGRQLRPGDVVETGGARVRVARA